MVTHHRKARANISARSWSVITKRRSCCSLAKLEPASTRKRWPCSIRNSKKKSATIVRSRICHQSKAVNGCKGITPGMMRKMHWLNPVLVAQIKFGEWTRDKKLRQPVFLGLREDKKPSEVTCEG